MTEKWPKITYLPADLQAQDWWAKYGPTFAIELGSLVRSWAAKESKYLSFKSLLQCCFLMCTNRAIKEFEHAVVNFVSSNSSAGVWDNNHWPQSKSFTCLYYHILFVDVTSAVHGTALLSVLDGKQSTVFDNHIDTGAKATEDVLFHRFNYFFHLMIAREHCNKRKICLFYYYIYYCSLPELYRKKTQIS